MAHDRPEGEQPTPERDTQWQGDDAFGAGWGNQTTRDEPPEPEEGAAFGSDAAPGDLGRAGAGHAGMFGDAGPDFAIHDARWAEAVERVREHMDVAGSDGGHVGIVDCVRGEHVILTKSDAKAGGVHHGIPAAWIARVEDKVILHLTAAEAIERWRIEGRSRALFEREGKAGGPHVLGRSFSGTYTKKK